MSIIHDEVSLTEKLKSFEQNFKVDKLPKGYLKSETNCPIALCLWNNELIGFFGIVKVTSSGVSYRRNSSLTVEKYKWTEPAIAVFIENFDACLYQHLCAGSCLDPLPDPFDI